MFASLSPVSIGAVGFAAVVFLLVKLLGKRRNMLEHLPVYGEKGQSNFYDAFYVAARQSRDKPFTVPDIPTEQNSLVLPAKYINDIKSLPSDTANFSASIDRNLSGQYSGLGVVDHAVVGAVRTDLTRNIARTLEGLHEESDHCIPKTIGKCEDWTPIQLYPNLTRIVAYLSGRIFVGLPLCRDEEWIESSIKYTSQCFNVVAPVQKLNPLFRPFTAWRLPEMKLLQALRVRGADMLRPVLEARLSSLGDPMFEPPVDMLQFVMNHSGEQEAKDMSKQALSQMNLSMAAIHTTAMNVTHLMYDLCEHPEYIQPLREEVEQMLKEDGGVFVKSSMTKLRKMDSCIKESQRFNPPSITAMTRVALKDITLHDGFVVPAGTQFSFNALAINFSPELYPEPEKFKGFRFSDLRSSAENQANKHQFVTTGIDAMSFGHGPHACPGRFFASNEIKILLSGLLMRYDFKFEKGASRPKNTLLSSMVAPCRNTKILFRERK